VDDANCRRVVDAMTAGGLAVGVWDITSDIGVATFACVTVDQRPGDVGQIYTSHGSGSHPSRAIALLRALTEAAQTRLTFIAGARDDADREFFERARAPGRIAKLRAELAATPDAARAFAAVATCELADFEADVRWLRARLAAVGVAQIAIVDLSQPRFAIPVVRVIAPGLESLHGAPGYVPGARAKAVRP
jgi:ribosomal protein S12 methylthiotransferase accessory factor